MDDGRGEMPVVNEFSMLCDTSLLPGMEVVDQITVNGNLQEAVWEIYALNAGGYLLVGGSDSDSLYDKSNPNFGSRDVWIVKLDEDLEIVWEQSYGGHDYDEAQCAYEDSNGNIFIGARSGSFSDTTFTEDGFDFDYDYWMLKLNNVGELLWDVTYGGDGDESLRGIHPVGDGNLMLVGYSSSDSSKTRTVDGLGFRDLFVVVVDSLGNSVNQSAFGGCSGDFIYQSVTLNDGNVLCVGASSSSTYCNGDPMTSYGSFDFWAIKLDQNGNEIWTYKVGSPGDDRAFGVVERDNGNIILVGKSNGDSNEVKSKDNYGEDDIWIVEINSEGDDYLYENSFGGDFIDVANAALVFQDDLYVVGVTMSLVASDFQDELTGGTSQDASIFRLSDSLTIEMHENIGGNHSDEAHSVIINNESLVVLCASNSGVGGDKTSESYSLDYWAVELIPGLRGCTDSGACNYNHCATIDDGSCDLSCHTCTGDADLNGFVNVLDLLSVSSNVGCSNYCLGLGDADFNGQVNVLDLVAVSSNFGAVCD